MVLGGVLNAVYDIIVFPPLSAGAVNGISTLVLDGFVNIPIVGGFGTVLGVTALLASLSSLLPLILVA